jgi:hypothetical protein
MKAISVRQPYAGLIVQGEKTIEMRTWQTSYRGSLLICSGTSRTINIPNREERAAFDAEFPRGVAVGIVDLVCIRKFNVKDAEYTGEPFICELVREEFKPEDMADYDGFSWILENPRKIKPFPVKGKLMLFDVELPK